MDSSVPLPETEDEIRAEHERQQAREASDSIASGYAEWEVRVALLPRGDRGARRAARGRGPSGRAALDVPARGGVCDDAEALVERLRRRVLEAQRSRVEPGGGMVWEVMPHNPFAVFGGLGARQAASRRLGFACSVPRGKEADNGCCPSVVPPVVPTASSSSRASESLLETGRRPACSRAPAMKKESQAVLRLDRARVEPDAKHPELYAADALAPARVAAQHRGAYVYAAR